MAAAITSMFSTFSFREVRMLTKISAITAAVTAVCNLLVIFSVVSLSGDQVAAINVAIVAVGTAFHALLNPKVPVGYTE